MEGSGGQVLVHLHSAVHHRVSWLSWLRHSDGLTMKLVLVRLTPCIAIALSHTVGCSKTPVL